MIIIENNFMSKPKFVMNPDIEKAFLKGSLWPNIYSFYKYAVNDYKPKSEFESLIYMLQVYSFAALELTLYLDVNPNDREALDVLDRINNEKSKISNYIKEYKKGVNLNVLL